MAVAAQVNPHKQSPASRFKLYHHGPNWPPLRCKNKDSDFLLVLWDISVFLARYCCLNSGYFGTGL